MALITHVALLRGINVGGKNKVSMPDLAKGFTEAGASGVRTYIQSGNVVFDAPAKDARRICTEIEEGLASRLGLRVPVVLRTAAALEKVSRTNPFLAEGADPAALHVMFLADRPKAKDVAALDPDRSPPDSFRVVGEEIFLHCPNGVGNSKLTNAWFDRALHTTSTSRNWRTLLALIELAAK
jgi:uncharacterized protein (DUF1697 family)